MNAQKRGSTSEMQVTSIRLEAELKERLRELSREQGYQTLIRDVLWQFVERQAKLGEFLYDGEQRLSQRENGSALLFCPSMFSMLDFRATFRSIAQQDQQCALTGQLIRPQQPMWLRLIMTGEVVPLSLEMTGYGEEGEHQAAQ